MAFIKVDEIEVDDLIRVTHRGIMTPVIVRDIEYRPRALVLQVETEAGMPISVPFGYGTPVELRT